MPSVQEAQDIMAEQRNLIYDAARKAIENINSTGMVVESIRIDLISKNTNQGPHFIVDDVTIQAYFSANKTTLLHSR